MDPSLSKSLALVALVVIVLRLAWLVHQRSLSRSPIHGGALSVAFNFLSGMCFVAVLPTVCLSVLVLHPDAVEMAGVTWHPLIIVVVGFGLGSLVFALLHALVERAPLQRAQQTEAARDARGWTEQDAKTSGL